MNLPLKSEFGSDAMPWDIEMPAPELEGAPMSQVARQYPAEPEAEVVEATTLPPREKPTIGFDLIERTKEEVLKFGELVHEVRAGIKMLAPLTISDQASYDKAYELSKLVQNCRNAIEHRRTELVKPHNDLVGNINQYAKSQMLQPLDNAITAVRVMMIAFNKAEKERKEAEAAKLEQQRKEIAAKAEEDAKAVDAAKAKAQAQVGDKYGARQAEISAMKPGLARVQAQRALDKERAEAETAVETTFEKVQTEALIDKSLAMADVRNAEEDLAATKQKGAGLKWTFEITDITKVPDIYKEVVAKLVNAAIKAGEREIPGLRIFQEDKLTLR